MNLNTLTAQEVASFDRAQTFVLVPAGSTEPHGPHLPLGTKAYLAEALAFEIGQHLKEAGLKYLMAPVFPYLPCQASLGLEGALTISPRTACEILYEIGAACHRDGFRNVAFIHLSTSPDATKAILTACDELSQLDGMTAIDPLAAVRFTNPPATSAALKQEGTDPLSELHGDARETGAMLYLDPDLVKADCSAILPPRIVNLPWESLKGNFSWKDRGAVDGYAGTPAAASPKLGQLYLEELGRIGAESILTAYNGGQPPALPLSARLFLKLVSLDDL
ncbi:creatininase family protein [Candidatus Ozemobacteraceae bacterium]|nr:creatininase family protein [Candidatus Ozemobacteraceae bacterium]